MSNMAVTTLDKTGLEIAIIGISGRFPGAKNLDEFWKNLQTGTESIDFFTDEEMVALGIAPALLKDPNFVKAKPAIKDIELFDASFFGFSAREAEIIDPQQRLFLECAWEALENAGYDSEKYQGLIGVYGGTSINSYMLKRYAKGNLLDAIDRQQLSIASDKDYLTTRVSYKLNLEGTSVDVQTACSTSLVAVHLACRSLLSGELDMALAGGVSISETVGYLYQEGGISSPDGHCRAFDAKAQGTLGGDGVGIVVLKRLEDALADGDCIHAVIKGSATNNDGSAKVSYAAPRIDTQAKVIRTAQVIAEVEPETITYIEAHGTGTPLGDPIEIAALTQAFRTSTENIGFCAIGSVKTNIGHLDAAAGVTGLIKTVLALKHKQIPPSLHFEQPNPQIDFANSPFYVNSTLSEWKTNGIPRRAGVSSFGIGGTNAHVILEEAPTVESSGLSRPCQLLLLSAKTSTALETATANLANYLQQHPDVNLADVAYTLQVGRRGFDYRRAIVCCDLNDAVAALSNPESPRVKTQHYEPSHRPIVFMFSGQGSQYVNMARELYETEPTFATLVDRCCFLLKPHLGLDLRQILYPNEAQAQIAAEKLQQTAITQSALFAIEYALAQLWMSWGITPEATIGHSIGEYVAATIAGVFSLEDALAIVAARGRLMQQQPKGAMLSVQLPAASIEPLLFDELSIAAINAPNSCVVSGAIEAVEALHKQLEEKGIALRRLHTSHAFHSPAMQPIIEPFTQLLLQVKLNPPKIPFISNVTGTRITPQQATDPNYWAQHLKEPVRFSSGIAELLSQPYRILLEVGPGRTLSTLAKQHQIAESVVLTSLRHPQEQQSDVAFLLDTLGKLWLSGVTINWSGFYDRERRHRIPLPTYPFERQRYWIELPSKVDEVNYRQSNLDKKPDIANWFYLPSWKQSMPVETFEGTEVKSKNSCWLVFIDECGTGEQIAPRLEQYSPDVVTVRVGEKFTKFSDRAFAIAPQNQNDYDVLVQALHALGKTPDKIAHLWSLTPKVQTQSSFDFFATCQNLGFFSLLFLVQALGKQDIDTPVEITVLTNEVYNISGEENLCPEKATVLGLCKVIPQEYPNITCRSVDVALPEAGSFRETKLIEELLEELIAKISDLAIAYRGGHRWVQTFEPTRLQDAETTRLREEGVYLITGGLGGIGLTLAEYLAKTVRAKLILVSRSGLPEKDEWEHWLITHNEADEISRKIRKVQRLENLGAQVLICRADVADLEQMQVAIERSEERFGVLHGVIHAAGIRLYGTVQQISKTECDRQLRSTGNGLFVLEKILQGRELDFCVLISSLSSVIGVLGMAAYPAAHIFTDAFAYKHNQTSAIPWISINCDNWLTEETSEVNASKGVDLLMTLQEGVEVFKRVLSTKKVTQIVVSIADLKSRIEQWIKPKFLQDLETTKTAKLTSLHSRPNLQNAYVEPRNEIEQSIANIWQELLGIEKVGIHDNFFELGGDSILSIQVSGRSEKVGFRITPKHLFEQQTIAELAEVVETTRFIQAEQGLITGFLPLTPIQHWFFAQNQPDPHHWNQAVLLEVLQVLDPALLERSLQQLLIHHDALRLRFVHSAESGWQQVNASPDDAVPFTRLDLSALPPNEQKSVIEETAAELQASLNLSSGPILRVALFDLGVHQSSRLLIIIHHLAVDYGSWRILLEDLQTVYQQLSRGETIQLPAKTTSFKQWAEQLKEYSRSLTVRQQLDYWLAQSQSQVSRLPVDYPGGANTVASAQTVSVALSVEETQVLLQEVPAIYRSQTEEVLLVALVEAFTRQTGKPLLVDLEGNGREVNFDGIDVSRTVGWFTTIYPVRLDLSKAIDPGEALQAVKEQLRGIKNVGIDYGVLRYLNEASQFQALLRAEVSFLYTGQLAQSLPKSSLLALTQEFSGANRSQRGSRSHLLEITAFVSEGQLRLDWTYSENLHRQTTIERLAENYLVALRAIVTHCQSSDPDGYRSFDFSDVELSQEQLEKALEEMELG